MNTLARLSRRMHANKIAKTIHNLSKKQHFNDSVEALVILSIKILKLVYVQSQSILHITRQQQKQIMILRMLIAQTHNHPWKIIIIIILIIMLIAVVKKLKNTLAWQRQQLSLLFHPWHCPSTMMRRCRLGLITIKCKN